jgi:hypothetical protein
MVADLAHAPVIPRDGINDLMPDVALTKSITDSINADYDVDGNMIGIEFLSLKINFGEEFRVRRRD